MDEDFISQLAELAGDVPSKKVIRQNFKMRKLCKTKSEFNSFIEAALRHTTEAREYIVKPYDPIEVDRDELNTEKDKTYIFIKNDENNPEDVIEVFFNEYSYIDKNTGEVICYSEWEKSSIENVMGLYTGSLDLRDIFSEYGIPQRNM